MSAFSRFNWGKYCRRFRKASPERVSLSFSILPEDRKEESRYWLRRVKKRGLISNGNFFDKVEGLSKQLNAYISRNLEKMNV